MAKIDPKYRGALLPGAAEQHQRALADMRKAARLGASLRVQILGPGKGQCPVADAQRDVTYPLDKVPSLPLIGCYRAPCCACCYSPVVMK